MKISSIAPSFKYELFIAHRDLFCLSSSYSLLRHILISTPSACRTTKYHSSACVGPEVHSGLQRADTMTKLTSAGMMTEFIWENMTVLDLTVKAD